MREKDLYSEINDWWEHEPGILGWTIIVLFTMFLVYFGLSMMLG
jgi:hypothetical protein